MYKIFFITVFILIFFSVPSYAMTSAQYVSALENRLFGATYDKQPIEKRIDRIEMQIYDKSYAGTPEERLSKIDKIYPQAEFEKPQTSANNNYYQEENSYNDYAEQEYPPSDYNNYPIVSKIEQTIYNKNYSGEDIYKRLARLEKELYGQEKNSLTLQERVENLKSVLPKKERNPIANSEFAFKGFGFNAPTGSSGQYFETASAIKELENETFRRTFDGEDNDKRLGRLEHFYFGQTSSGQDENERITRLASVLMSEKNMNAGMSSARNAQWAELLINLVIIGLGFLL